MLIMAIIDGIMIAMLFMFSLSLPQPWYDNNVRNLWPLIPIERQVINSYIIDVWESFFDTSKQYSLRYIPSQQEFILQEWCGKMLVNPLWIYLGSQTIWTKYCIKVNNLHPLEFETIFPEKNLHIKSN